MKKAIVRLIVPLLLALGLAVPAFAHVEMDPCVETAEPGHSEFAHHHVRPLVPEAGHAPGAHQGFSHCVRPSK